MKWFSAILLIFVHVLSLEQTRPDVVLTTGHNDQINAMDVTSDGRFLASASNDKQIKIWDLATGFEFRTISGSDGRVEQIVFSSDNKTLAGTSFNDELLLWDVITGELIYSGEAGSGRGLKFSKNGKSLFYINTDSKIAEFDLESQSHKIISARYTTEFVFDTDRALIYTLDHLGNLHKINANDGTEIQTFKLFDEFNYPFSNCDLSPDGKYIGFGFNDDKFRLFNTESGTFEFVSNPYKSKIISLAFDRKKPIVYISTHENHVVLFNYKTRKKVSDYGLNETTYRIQVVRAHPNGELVLFASHDLITLYDFNQKKVFKSLSRKVNRIFNMTCDPTGKYMAVATDKLNLQIWDLGINKVVDSIAAFFPCQFTPDGKYILAMTNLMKLGLFDIENGQKVKSFDTDYELIQSLAISADGSKIAGAGYQNKIKIWEVETQKKIVELEGHTAGILALDFHPTKPLIVSGSLDQTSRVWNYDSKTEIKLFTDQTISIHDVKFSPDGTQLATASWDKTIFLRSTQDWSTQHELKGHVNIVNSIDYAADSKTLISGAGNNSVGAADNSIICWNAKLGNEICQFTDHKGEILKVIADPIANRFYSASVDGAIKYSDYETCELIATYQAIGSKEFMIYTPDNYYIASRNALQGIAFRIGDKIVPFEQFDIHLNRPDIVADRIGKSHPQLIKAYYYLYKKRLKKLNLEEGAIQMDYQLPNLVNETKYELVNSSGTQKFWIKAWDDNYSISSVSVFVNNVPIFGAAGLQIDGDVKAIRKEIEVPLIQGKNRILISCRNSNGVESLYKQMEIYREGRIEKHDLYIVGIGVSDYKDERFNLKYPTKDANDILTKFSESENRYNTVYSKLLLNENVTRENIIGLTDFFTNCTHEDLAIIFIAGHGVLNIDYDYFFGTYDMDFDAPEGRGLPYSSISALLNQIRAYERF